MKTYLECVPCIVRQALEAARFVTPDPAVQERLLRFTLKILQEMDMSWPPPAIGQIIHRHLREMLAVEDPYREAKERFNRLALQMRPELRRYVLHSADPLEAAARLSIAGNSIDLGLDGSLTEQQVQRFIAEAMTGSLTGDLEAFRSAVQRATKILFLADNAGEIVFDRLLIEQLPASTVTVAVRGRPILNDATREDAVTAGLDRLVTIIDNGSDAPGTLLGDCSPMFRQHFHESDLIIAKGQGNFESLSETPGPIFFLFKVKCPVVAGHAAAPLHSLMMRTAAWAEPRH